MPVIHARSKRKPSGGLLRNTLTKRTHMLGRTPTLTKVGEKERKKSVKTKGGSVKQRVFETNTVNIYNPKTKKQAVGSIKHVLENPANRNFVRRNILTRGTLVETDKGKARITSRPGQDGVVNAVLE